MIVVVVRIIVVVVGSGVVVVWQWVSVKAYQSVNDMIGMLSLSLTIK